MEKVLNRIREKVRAKVAECNAAAGPPTPIRQKCDDLKNRVAALQREKEEILNQSTGEAKLSDKFYGRDGKSVSPDDVNMMLWDAGEQDRSDDWLKENILTHVDNLTPVDSRKIEPLWKRLFLRTERRLTPILLRGNMNVRYKLRENRIFGLLASRSM